MQTANATLADVANRFIGNGDAISLDSDLRLALEDMCAAANGAHWRQHWQKWLSQMINDSLRSFLGQ